jgi:hypothetical protein
MAKQSTIAATTKYKAENFQYLCAMVIHLFAISI